MAERGKLVRFHKQEQINEYIYLKKKKKKKKNQNNTPTPHHKKKTKQFIQLKFVIYRFFIR